MQNTQADSFSQMLADFYEKKSNTERIRHHAANMTHTLQNARDRMRRKLAAQRKELSDSQNRDKFKRRGDLITANLYQIEQGARKVKVIDYYDPACPEVELNLDARLTPQQNAQRQFKLYTKAKNASMEEYLKATGFEALVGYLYLQKEYERMNALIAHGIEALQGK